MRSKRGVTMAEAVVASFLLGVIVLGLIQAMSGMGKATNNSRQLTAATGLAQEEMEVLKSQNYYNVVPSSSVSYDANFNPALEYDNAYYAPQTFSLGGTSYIRRVFIQKVDVGTGNVLVDQGYPHPDTGIMRITVHTVWQMGTTWHKVVLSSITYDPNRQPLTEYVYGQVTDSSSGLPLQGVVVSDRRDPAFNGTSNASGNYGFWVSDNNMVVQATLNNYAIYNSSAITLPAYPDNQVLWNFQMVSVTSRTVEGYAMYNPNLVISQVCAQWSATSQTQYVELYNPSTSTVLVSSQTLGLQFVNSTNSVGVSSITFITPSIASYGYYLIVGSTAPITTLKGLSVDATYYFPRTGGSTTQYMDSANPAGIILTDGQNDPIDSLGWGSTGSPAPSIAVSTLNTAANQVNLPNAGFGSAALTSGEALYRKALSTSTAANMLPPGGKGVPAGNAWNSWNTFVDSTGNVDFVGNTSPVPRNSTATVVQPMGGTVWPGAHLFFDDTYNAIANASTSTATSGGLGFYVTTVSVGTWGVIMSSVSPVGALEGFIPDPNVKVVAADKTEFENLVATYTTTMGFISGHTLLYGTSNLGGLLVEADPGGYQTTSNTSGDVGLYFFRLPSGEQYTITGNPGFANPNYNTGSSSAPITVDSGIEVANTNIGIWLQGQISGQVTANGTTQGIPNVVIVATGGFVDGNTSVTDGNGNYTISGLRLVGNPYTVFPELQFGQSASPAKYQASVSQGGDNSGNNFVLSGAYLPITGSATSSGVAIGTGVLIMASTVSYSVSTPPVVNFALRATVPYYYQTFTNVDGSYELDVPGGSTYYLTAWYTQATTTTYKTSSVVVTSTAGVVQNFTWP